MENTVIINIPPHILKHTQIFLKCSVFLLVPLRTPPVSGSRWEALPVALLSSHHVSDGGSSGLVSCQVGWWGFSESAGLQTSGGNVYLLRLLSSSGCSGRSPGWVQSILLQWDGTQRHTSSLKEKPGSHLCLLTSHGGLTQLQHRAHQLQHKHQLALLRTGGRTPRTPAPPSPASGPMAEPVLAYRQPRTAMLAAQMTREREYLFIYTCKCPRRTDRSCCSFTLINQVKQGHS